MGIKNLSKLIKRFATNSNKSVHLNTFTNKIVAYDIYGLLYKLLNTSNDNDHVFYTNFVKTMLNLLKYDITPVCIFDGKPPAEKKGVIDKRRKNNLENKLKYQNYYKQLISSYSTSVPDEKTLLKEHPKLFQLKRKIIKHPTQKHIKNCKNLLSSLGIPHLTAISESDILCSKLSKKGLVDAVISNDFDMIPYGCNIMITNFNSSVFEVETYDLSEVLSSFEVTMDQLIDICILAGCDYTCTIKKVAIIKSYHGIKKYENIENFISNLPSTFVVPEEFDYNSARMMFKEAHLLENDINVNDIQRKNINFNNLVKLCRELCNISHRNVYTMIKKFSENLFNKLV